MARQFSANFATYNDKIVLLNDGAYAGVIHKPSIASKDKQYITLAEEIVWKDKEPVKTGEYVLQGLLSYSVALTSKKACKALQRDTPIISGGFIRLAFDQESFQLSKENNVQLVKFLEVLGLRDEDFASQVDWEYQEDIEVPEELAGVANIVDRLNSVNYHRALFTIICNSIIGLPVKANVLKQSNKKTGAQENVLNMGAFGNPLPGILTYVDGCEEDLAN